MDKYKKISVRFGPATKGWNSWSKARRLIYNTIMEHTSHQSETLGTPTAIMRRTKWNSVRRAMAFDMSKKLEEELK